MCARALRVITTALEALRCARSTSHRHSFVAWYTPGVTLAILTELRLQGLVSTLGICGEGHAGRGTLCTSLVVSIRRAEGVGGME